MASSRPPVTPVKDRNRASSQSLLPTAPSGGVADPGRQHAVRLNETYHLGLQLADDSQPRSPAEQERLARLDVRLARQNSIIQLLRFHHYKDPGQLQAVLNNFDLVALGLLAPDGRTRASMGAVLPSPAVLQQSLLNLLEQSKATLVQGMKTWPPATPVRTSARTPARPSPVSHSLSPAVAHYLPARDAITTDIDQVPVVQRIGASALRQNNQTNAAVERWMQGDGSGHAASRSAAAENNVRSASSASSAASSDMFSAIDSFVEPRDSQTTVNTAAIPTRIKNEDRDEEKADFLQEEDGYTTEEFEASPQLHRAASNDSFAASDDLLEAFEESFSQLQQQQSREPSPASNIPDLATLRIADDGSEEPSHGRLKVEKGKSKARTTKKSGDSSTVPGLRDRLEGIFPPTPAWLQHAPFPIIWETTRIAMRCGVDLSRELSAPPPIYSPAWDENQAVFRTALANNPMFEGRRLPEPMPDLTWESAMGRLPVVQGLGTQRVPVYTIQLHFSESARRGTSHEVSTTAPSKINIYDDGPLYYAQLLPIATDLPHRLSRHYGTDRFIEVLFPSHHSSVSTVPRILKNFDAAVQEVNAWLTRQRHDVAGRRWAAFYVKDGGYSKKPDNAWEQTMQPISNEALETIILKRVYLFAEESVTDISSSQSSSQSGSGSASRLCIEPLDKITVYEMLDWLLCFNRYPKNRKQPYLKLFSRIALGLSRTKPTVVFRPDQITHHQEDVLSPTGSVMNDGIGRMSLSIARKLRTALELSDLPTAVQGRIGSAKGMWILDTEDPGKLDWIETYPSQRKWLLSEGELDGDYHEEDDALDPDQRTLEIRHFASEIGRSSSLNLQFIPLVEDRAIDKPRMRRTLARILEGDLTRDLAAQRDALKHPLLFSAWVQENARFRNNYLSTYGGEAVGGQVPFLGGRPDSDEDIIQFLLAGGFHPLQQRYLWEKAYDLQMNRCKRLQSKLSVRVGRAAHLLMVIDFLGVLEEGEVQVCFSSKFQVEADTPLGGIGESETYADDDGGDDGSFSDTLLVGMDVLVARSPAHFPGDMQKVRAVFRPELSALKDVVIFSRKGNSPLADKLSGGDYDGDMSWVCWDPRIVDNFENAPERQEQINLIDMGYMRKIKTTMEDLAAEPKESPTSSELNGYPSAAFQTLLEKSFEFNMRENLLGKITTFKEHLCYFRGSISDRTSIILSSLLSDLVDQAKQGNVFAKEDFKRLREECLGGLRSDKRQPPPSRLPVPAYKQSRLINLPTSARNMDRITDFLKFDVAIPVIARELKALEIARDAMIKKEQDRESQSDIESSGTFTEGFFDPDLAEPARQFETLASKSAVCHAIFDALKSDIEDVKAAWDESCAAWKNESKSSSSAEDPGYPQRVLRVYNKWCAIGIRLPDVEADRGSGTHASLATPSRGPATPRRGTPAAAQASAYLGTPKETPLKSPFKKAPRGSVWSDAESKSIPSLLQQDYLGDPVYSQWALIRASQTFRMLHKRRCKLTWDLAGRQLQVIKAMATKTSTSANPNADNGTAGAKVMMTPLMFAASKPDRKVIKRMTARLTASSLSAGDVYEHDGDLFYDADDGFQLFADDT
ncbi:rna-dependent rna polymerase [Ophiostoma piceae UAMH 11346]|uniref:Rna-dependent rna polymerase n=1 Tax=Ophiostoma piceae (strain UAMH 11346) TaxID=1262450 RepID=S3CKA4_OPHP1|nr:rna-dependent rna polymerase [Ophiostoma piceae UAMH 11346]